MGSLGWLPTSRFGNFGRASLRPGGPLSGTVFERAYKRLCSGRWPGWAIQKLPVAAGRPAPARHRPRSLTVRLDRTRRLSPPRSGGRFFGHSIASISPPQRTDGNCRGVGSSCWSHHRPQPTAGEPGRVLIVYRWASAQLRAAASKEGSPQFRYHCAIFTVPCRCRASIRAGIVS